MIRHVTVGNQVRMKDTSACGGVNFHFPQCADRAVVAKNNEGIRNGEKTKLHRIKIVVFFLAYVVL